MQGEKNVTDAFAQGSAIATAPNLTVLLPSLRKQWQRNMDGMISMQGSRLVHLSTSKPIPIGLD